MARLARLAVGGLPHHIVHRGHNGQSVFLDVADREFFCHLLLEVGREHAVALHAYVLMDSDFHLLLTPVHATDLSRLMQGLGRRYVRYFNDRYGRKGTLWEGRYRSTLLQAERYLMACMAFMDLSPVREHWVVRAADYPWSSYGHYAGVRTDSALSPPAQYWALGNTPFAREAAYADMVSQGLPSAVCSALAESAIRGWALGDAGFVAQTQNKTKRRITKATPGRPVLPKGAKTTE